MNRMMSVTVAAAAFLIAAGGQPGGAPGPQSVAVSQIHLGSKIAFVTDRNGRDAPDVMYVMNADGTNEHPLQVLLSGNSLFPEWSPDGQTIAFHNNDAQIGGPEIPGVVPRWETSRVSTRRMAARFLRVGLMDRRRCD